RKKKTNRPRRGSKPKAASARGGEARGAHEIVAALQDAGRPLTLAEIAERLRMTSAAARSRLSEEIDRMRHAGDLVLNRRNEYCLRERLPLVVGTVSAHRDGHGFVMSDDRSAPLYLAPRQMLEVIHGDRVAARPSGVDARGRPEGTI